MAVAAKICGINSPEALGAALRGGADYVGLVFYPPSPRSVTPTQARALAAAVPEGPLKVALLVDPDDELLRTVIETVGVDLLQLHGAESPARVVEIRTRFGLPVMKAVKIAGAEDVAAADRYCAAADRLLFDAKPPKDLPGVLPGGNALAFDWQLLAGRRWPRPWMLSGGLNADNLAEAVRTAGAPAVDVSSGVEDRPEVKNPDKIRAFLAAAKTV